VLVFAVIQLLNVAPALAGDQPATDPATTVKPQDVSTLQQQIATLSGQLDGLTKSRDALKDRLDSISQQGTHAQWLLSIILGIFGLFTVAQGLFAFFSAQNYVKQAEDAIKRANDAESAAKAASATAVEEMNKLREVVQSRFPLFSEMESERSAAFAEIGKLTSVLELDSENLYLSSHPLVREKIFAVESFSRIQFLNAANRGREIIRNLRLLGRLYAGKFASDNPPLQSDFDRAYYCFDLASQKSNRHFSILNDLGLLFTIANKIDDAKALFNESLRSQPDQQRALYNLGTLAFERTDRARLEEARKYLLKAKTMQNWEDSPNLIRVAHVDYNIACTFDALAALDPAAEAQLLGECVNYMELAAVAGAQSRKLLEDDLKSGDLRTLGASSVYTARLDVIKTKYQTAWAAKAIV
jgi:tetratricopeptide (TPR) repeat protein